MIMLVALAVVGFCYFGGNNCPKVLKDNKEMLLGVVVGLALCSFMGVRLVEGYGSVKECLDACSGMQECIHHWDRGNICREVYHAAPHQDSQAKHCTRDTDCNTANGYICIRGSCLRSRPR